jgi:hypothetical protein
MKVHSDGKLRAFLTQAWNLEALLEDYRLIVERRSALPNNPESYAGGSLSSWYDHPCQTSQRVGARRSIIPGFGVWTWGE